MYRYEVTLAVKNDIEGVTGKFHFYDDSGKYYIDEIVRHVSITYLNDADVFETKNFDQICDDLYSTDFDAQSTRTAYTDVEQVEFASIQEVIIDKGTHTFDTKISHDWTDTATWPSVSDSVWQIEPSAADKKILLTRAEVQFTHDVAIATAVPAREFYFDVWVYNPLFNSGAAIDADDETFVPGVSSGNPLRFLYNRSTYTSLRDVFNYGNNHYTMNVAVDGMLAGITTVQFNYDQHIEIRGDQGAQVRFSMKDNLPMGGDFCTVSVVIREENI